LTEGERITIEDRAARGRPYMVKYRNFTEGPQVWSRSRRYSEYRSLLQLIFLVEFSSYGHNSYDFIRGAIKVAEKQLKRETPKSN
jgi:hypothetical protein